MVRYEPIRVMAAFAFLLMALLSFPPTTGAAQRHPVEVEKAVCSECHTDERAALDHMEDWITGHKFFAMRDRPLCSVCHQLSFCTDCHAGKGSLKPSDRYKDMPGRALPHRGNYLTQHMIDGRVNPAPCFRCHGRQNNERCKLCHR
jgi:hypothetical protein